MVWPSVLREWFWRMKTSGTSQHPVSIRLANIPKFWTTVMKSDLDARFKYMSMYILPTLKSLAATNAGLRGLMRPWSDPEIISRPMNDLLFRQFRVVHKEIRPWIQRESVRCFWGKNFTNNWLHTRWNFNRSTTSDVDPSNASTEFDSNYDSA